MTNPIKSFSLALASAIALGIIGCGSQAQGPVGLGPDIGPDIGPGPGPIAGPPDTEPLAYPTVVAQNHFDPKTEDELKATYDGGEYYGRPISNYGYMIARVRPGFDPMLFEQYGLEPQGSFSINGATYCRLYKEDGVLEAMNNARNLYNVLYIEPELMYYGSAGFSYDNPDTYVGTQQQYGVLTTQTKKAWETYGFGSHKPVVVDIDSGVAYNHEDIKGVVRHAFNWFDEYGYTPLPGSIQTDPAPEDWLVTHPNEDQGTDYYWNAHGTHTAGTIAALGNNGKGVAGMCWNVDFVSYKGLSHGNSGSDWSVFAGLWHLAKWKNEKVDGAARYPHTIPVNFSLGSSRTSQFAADMMEMALEHDIVMICASGNDFSGLATWPSSYTGAIRVGAVNYLDRRAQFSNWGPDMSVMAPGEAVYSTVPPYSDYKRYEAWDGTSMAAPHVTGLVAYMLSFAPDLKPDQIKTYLERYADPIDGQKGFDPRYGHGRINTYRTIGAVIDNAVPVSDYALTPVKVVATTLDGSPINGATVYLYNTNEDGTITSYAGAATSGPSYVGVRDNPAEDIEEGVAWFNLLKPGFYKAAVAMGVRDYVGTTLSGSAESEKFEVRRGLSVAPVALKIDMPVPVHIYVQAYRTSQQTFDSVLEFWDYRGNHIDNRDWGVDPDGHSGGEHFDFILGTPGPFWIKVRPWATWNQGYGDYGYYALSVATSQRLAYPAPGTYENPGPDGIVGSLTHTRDNSSQLIEINGKVAYGYIRDGVNWNDEGDWYRFVME
jgi:hypothetical protein